MEIFFKVCNSLSVAPSAVLATAERYAALLSQNGWGVVSQQLDFAEDKLMQEAQNYYSTSGFRHRVNLQAWNQNVSVLNGPIYNLDGSVTLMFVIMFALDPKFKEHQINFNNQVAATASGV